MDPDNGMEKTEESKMFPKSLAQRDGKYDGTQSQEENLQRG